MSALLPSHKATIITALLTGITVLLGFNVHLNKKQLREAETYYVLDSEENTIEEPESLDEILKSFNDLLSTNQAVNTSRPPEEFEDEDFRNTIDKIRNRSEQSSSETRNFDENAGFSGNQQEDLSSYESVNDIINLRSSDKREEQNSGADTRRASTVTYSLVDRSEVYLPPPIYLCEKGGKIVISITVDWKGNVTSASYNNASSSSDGCLVERALEYAKAARFNADSSKEKQIGTISFFFQPKY